VTQSLCWILETQMWIKGTCVTCVSPSLMVEASVFMTIKKRVINPVRAAWWFHLWRVKPHNISIKILSFYFKLSWDFHPSHWLYVSSSIVITTLHLSWASISSPVTWDQRWEGCSNSINVKSVRDKPNNACEYLHRAWNTASTQHNYELFLFYAHFIDYKTIYVLSYLSMSCLGFQGLMGNKECTLAHIW
jgi:hypothetical protein